MVGVSKITHTNQLSFINMHDKIINTKIYYIGIVANILLLLYFLVIIISILTGCSIKTVIITSEIGKIAALILMGVSMILFINNIRVCIKYYPQLLLLLIMGNILANPVIAWLIARKQQKNKILIGYAKRY